MGGQIGSYAERERSGKRRRRRRSTRNRELSILVKKLMGGHEQHDACMWSALRVQQRLLVVGQRGHDHMVPVVSLSRPWMSLRAVIQN